MRAVVQRVSEVLIDSEGLQSTIGRGLLIYLGVAPDDTAPDVEYLVDKVRHLRIFEDEAGKLNLDIVQVGGDVMAVSAFTVQGDVRRGRRPSFDGAAPGEQAMGLYDVFCRRLSAHGLRVERGFFGRHMEVRSINDGPICILLDSHKGF